MSTPHHTAAHGEPATHDDLGEPDSPPMLYAVYAAVVLLFFANLGLSISGALGGMTLVAQLVIATTQATLVAYYFMHLRQGDKVVVLTALASIFWTGILFVLFMSDYMTRQNVVGWW